MDRAMTDAANASDISAGGKKAIDMLLKDERSGANGSDW